MTSARGRLLRLFLNRALIVFVAASIGLFITFNVVHRAQNEEHLTRALTLAKSISIMPDVIHLVQTGDQDHELAPLALRIAKQTGASYIVFTDKYGIRLSHPNPALIGQRVDDASATLAGASTKSLDSGSLGISANGRAPVFNDLGNVVGMVSAGFLSKTFTSEDKYLQNSFIFLGFGIILLGFVLSEVLARTLRNRQIENELEETIIKYQERDAMLHAIKEGVITLATDRKITLINDEAIRLLGLNRNVIGRPIEEVLPPGRLLDLLEGETPQGEDEIVLNDNFSLHINTRPVRRVGRIIGSVITLRDRTEHVGLLRELDSVTNLTDALRAQQHEYSNRIHTVTGLIQLGRLEDVNRYLGEISTVDANLAEKLINTIANQTVTALLLAKVAIAREKGVKFIIDPKTSLDNIRLDPNAQITVIGNLIDNALDSVAGQINAQVSLTIEESQINSKLITVRDNGSGLPEDRPEVVFEEGFSTKISENRSNRGLGLAIVSRLVKQAGGSITCSNDDGAVFVVEIPVKDD
jgi:two-component system CitB family sensor kinase